MGDRDDPNDVMETSLTIEYDKQWLHFVSAIGPNCLFQMYNGDNDRLRNGKLHFRHREDYNCGKYI